MPVVVTGDSLTLDEVVRVARRREPVVLSDEARKRIRAARVVVERAVADGATVYGLTTGVGVRKRTRVEPPDVATFSRRLILEHRVGQGAPAPEPVVRAQMLLTANGFARGAGVRLERDRSDYRLAFGIRREQVAYLVSPSTLAPVAAAIRAPWLSARSVLREGGLTKRKLAALRRELRARLGRRWAEPA
jgi:hypothetical protein